MPRSLQPCTLASQKVSRPHISTFWNTDVKTPKAKNKNLEEFEKCERPKQEGTAWCLDMLELMEKDTPHLL